MIGNSDQDNNALVMTLQATIGSDAASFLIEMVAMYQLYTQAHHWTTQIHISNQGLKLEAVLSITGQGAYARLQFEQGIHRVQRVPLTMGRVRTSLVRVHVQPIHQTGEMARLGDDLQEKIRTYNVPLNQATDHRCNVTLHPLATVLAGSLDPFIDALNDQSY